MCSTSSSDDRTGPPAPPCSGENALVDNRALAPKSCLPSLEMQSPTAAGGLLPTGDAFTATKITLTSHLFSSTRLRKRTVSRLRLHTSRMTAAFGTCLLPLPTEESSRQNQEKIGRSIQAVLKVVSAPARFWDRGASCFAVRLCVWERLVMRLQRFLEEICWLFEARPALNMLCQNKSPAVDDGSRL